MTNVGSLDILVKWSFLYAKYPQMVIWWMQNLYNLLGDEQQLNGVYGVVVFKLSSTFLEAQTLGVVAFSFSCDYKNVENSLGSNIFYCIVGFRLTSHYSFIFFMFFTRRFVRRFLQVSMLLSFYLFAFQSFKHLVIRYFYSPSFRDSYSKCFHK